jgi:hypothetical protein
MTPAAGEPVQLLVYRFAAGAAFRGQLAGALERMEAGGALRVLDVLLVGTDAASGETFAVALHGGRAGGLTSALLDFRLGAQGRAEATRRALAPAGDQAALIEALAGGLPPGEALAAVLIGHAWARELAGAVERTGGRELANTLVGPATLLELRDELLAAAAD